MDKKMYLKPATKKTDKGFILLDMRGEKKEGKTRAGYKSFITAIEFGMIIQLLALTKKNPNAIRVVEVI